MRVARPLGAKWATNVVTLNVKGRRSTSVAEQEVVQDKSASSHIDKLDNAKNEVKKDGLEPEFAGIKFSDELWKNRTWDLNMFVKDGKMDWDGLFVAEAKRRKLLELHPQASTNEDPVLFKSSIIPWWAWLKRSYLPEAELLNGRAAMVGFFMAYVVDALTGLDVVGQTGNFMCKAGAFVTVVGIILFRKAQDFDNFKKLADEATLYDKQCNRHGKISLRRGFKLFFLSVFVTLDYIWVTDVNLIDKLHVVQPIWAFGGCITIHRSYKSITLSFLQNLLSQTD